MNLRTSIISAGIVTSSVLLGCCARQPDCPAARPHARFAEAHPSAGARSNAIEVARYVLTPAEAANVVCWARRGDNHAEFALGRAHEFGIGTKRNLNAAREYYERASRPESGRRSFYSAPVGNERYGSIINVPVASDEPGLPEAAEALRRLDALEPPI